MPSSGPGRRWWTGCRFPSSRDCSAGGARWLLLAQAMIVAGLIGMALSDPKLSLETIVWCALLVAFGSATQDIALDAFRIESADTQRQAALAAAYQTGYRLAMIWAGAGVLWIAARAEIAGAAALPARSLADRLSRDGGLDGRGRADGAALARADTRDPAAVAQRRRLAARRAGGALRRLPAPLPLAGGADPGPDRHLPHQRRGDGHHGQPLLRGHGLHQGRGGGRHQDLWRDHDAGRRLSRRRAGDALRRDARADAGRGAERGQQPAVRLAGLARPRCARR